MPIDFNWIDVLMLILIARVVYLGLRGRFLDEFINLLGMVAASFVTLHYFSRFGKVLASNPAISEGISEPLAFTIICLTVVVLFKLIAVGWVIIFRMEPNLGLDKWGGFVFSLARSLFICSLIFMLMFSTSVLYLGKACNTSFTGKYLIDLSPFVYKYLYSHLVRDYFPDEHLNVKAFSIRQLGKSKEKKSKKKKAVK